MTYLLPTVKDSSKGVLYGFSKGAGLAVRFLQQLLQLVGGIGFFDRIIGTHQSDRILFQIALFHAPVQERTHHTEVRIDGRIVELLVFHIEDIVLHRFLCDGMNRLLCIPQKPKEASALSGVEVERALGEVLEPVVLLEPFKGLLNGGVCLGSGS